jgi:hypothetical protein
LPGWMAKTPAGRRRQQDRYTQSQDQLAVLQEANEQRPPSQRRAPDKVVVSPGAGRRLWAWTKSTCSGPCTPCKRYAISIHR